MPAGTAKRRQIGGRIPSRVTFSVNVNIGKPLSQAFLSATDAASIGDSSSRASWPSAIRLSMIGQLARAPAASLVARPGLPASDPTRMEHAGPIGLDCNDRERLDRRGKTMPSSSERCII
jgi:hypothetical protein